MLKQAITHRNTRIPEVKWAEIARVYSTPVREDAK